MPVTPAPFEHYQFGFGSPYASHAQPAGSVIARAHGVPPATRSGAVGGSIRGAPQWGAALASIVRPFGKLLEQKSRRAAFGQPQPQDDGIREVGPTGIRTAHHQVSWNQRPLTQAQRPIMTAVEPEQYTPTLDWAAQPQPMATIGGAMAPARKSRVGTFGFGSGASSTA